MRRSPGGSWAGVCFLFITGDTAYKFWHQIMGQNNIPFPSFIDAIYVTMYPVLAVGLLLLARARVPGGDRASLLDSLTVTLGVGLLSWIFLIGPNVRAPGGMLVRLTAAAYPLGDVLVLAMLAHLWGSGGFRHTAGRLLAIGAVGTLVSDSLYGLANLHPSWNWHDGNPIDLGWILFYACWGAAALHPSMRALSEPRPARAPSTSRARLGAAGHGLAHRARPSCSSRRARQTGRRPGHRGRRRGHVPARADAHGGSRPGSPAGRDPRAGTAQGGSRTGGGLRPRRHISGDDHSRPANWWPGTATSRGDLCRPEPD